MGARWLIVVVDLTNLQDMNNENGLPELFGNDSPTVKLVIESVCREKFYSFNWLNHIL